MGGLVTSESEPMTESASQASKIYIVLQAAWHLCWALGFTLSLVYQVDVADLSPFQLVFVGTVLEATCFIGEIPTGVVADLRSRKLSVVIGLVLIGIGLVVTGAFPWFWPILLAQVIWGLGYTFVSGALEAWVTDEVGDQTVQPVFTRGHQWGLAMNIVGILLAGFFAYTFGNLQAPIILGGIGFIVMAIWGSLFMRETNFVRVPAEDRDNWGQMAEIARTGLQAARKPGVVRAFLLIGLLAGLTSEVFDRLWVDRLVNDFSLPNWFGDDSLALWFTLFALIASIIGLLASLLANRLAKVAVNAEHPTQVMALLSVLQVSGIIGFALAGNAGLALTGRWLYDAAISVGAPIQRAWLNRNVTSRARATTSSLMGQADALGQVAGGPAFGAIANAISIPVALVMAGFVQLPNALIYLRLRPNRKEATQLAESSGETQSEPE